MREWTDEQLAIFKAMAASSGHLQINAYAGTSKTTSLEEGARRAEMSALYLVFNKRNQLEAQGRMPKSIQPRTFNSLGHGAWARGSKVNLDTEKLVKVTKELFRGLAHPEDLDFGNVLNLARKARVVGLVPEGAPGVWKSLVPDTPESWEDLAYTYDLDADAESIDMARKVLKSSIALALGKSPTIDFDDQIYMPTLFGGGFTKWDTILVDEAQDLSRIQHHMVRKSLKPGGRVISVGDIRQAIYGFRGSDATSMSSLEDMFPGDRLALTMSFRCPQSVVREAQTVVPDIRPWTHATEGLVERRTKWRPEDIGPGHAILCRVNAPLFTVAWQLLAAGRGVTILGTDIGKGLVRLIRKLSPTDIPVERFVPVLDAWAAREIAIKPSAEAKISDKVESIRALASKAMDTGDLIRIIESLYSDKAGLITLSTIHKAKGLEWRHVWFLDSWRIPSPFAKQPWEQSQESNMKYVGITRAQHTLTYFNAGDTE
jgi:superfamily I DNA/RNA helicase